MAATGKSEHTQRPSVRALGGMVSAAHPLAARAGASLLDQGGNAFDAIVATAAALNVTESYMSGFAGLGMASCWVAAEKRVRTLDFITRVPEKFPVGSIAKGQTVNGPLASGVPGNLAGWAKLQSTYGRKSLAEAFAPAIALARTGFPITGFYLDMLAAVRGRPMSAEWARIFPFGFEARRGMVLRQPDLADTLEAIAQHGPGHLYGGALGRTMVDHLAATGGCITLADLEAVDPQWEEPVTAEYRGLTVNVPPPPAESFQFPLTLRLLAETDFGAIEHLSADHLDRVFRAIRLAAEIRIRSNKPSPDELQTLLSEETLAPLRALLDSDAPVWGRTEQHAAGPLADGPRLNEHTTSFSAMDGEGNAVCITQSLGSPFGSGVVVPGTGVCLNNFLNWGDLEPASRNPLVPGGRYAMCLAPSIGTRDGEAVLALGTPGSYGIMQTQSQAMVHLLDYGLELQAAIDAPRGRLFDGRLVNLESRVSPETTAALRQRGHDVQPLGAFSWSCGGMHAIARDPATGALEGAADSRRDGAAVAALTR
ncbi:gamma-glutamyltransferase family protein [Oceanibaculum pacificum]|uniref:Gamma-glutamyltranspeptidase n=1 Tax=Oceanibaculum pacificum TaxID=580166 RepID=A0A154W303_9PROT|nr:gamma-glutamyltransferase [Oceanibaculum pacificum]KZD07859.1 gamma-glutamyltranspeptidase [Oceanibaculum pacificum]